MYYLPNAYDTAVPFGRNLLPTMSNWAFPESYLFRVLQVLMCPADLCGLLRHMSTPGPFAPGATAKVHCFVSVQIAQQPSRQV